MDIEWAHTMAPAAEILLVEACSNSYTDLLYAEYVAGIEVSSYGGGDISNPSPPRRLMRGPWSGYLRLGNVAEVAQR